MDKWKILRKRKEKTKPISIRVPLSACKFMGEKNYSPTAILLEALRELGWKEE